MEKQIDYGGEREVIRKMDRTVKNLVNRILQLEANGEIAGAENMLEQLVKSFPDDEELLYEKALFEFRNQMDFFALLDFCEVYRITKNHDILRLILEAYYEPNREQLLECYEKNVKMLSDYCYMRAELEDAPMDICPLWYDDNACVWYNSKKDSFYKVISRNPSLDRKEQYVAILQCMWPEILKSIAEKTRIETPFLEMECAVYLIWENGGFSVFLQLHNVEDFLMSKRYVFFDSRKMIDFFDDYREVLPSVLFQFVESDFGVLFNELNETRCKSKIELCDQIKKFYDENKDAILEHVYSGKPKILFLTSRFTTALQFYSRDMKAAAEKAGCECLLSKESSGIQRCLTLADLKTISTFKPDMIVCMDHFRFEGLRWVPDNVVWVTWIQDPLPEIMNPNSVNRLLPRDIIINQFYSWSTIKNLYRGVRMIEASVPANEDIYRPYELTKENIDQYGADITLVTHFQSPEGVLKDFLNRCDEDMGPFLEKVMCAYKSEMYKNGTVFYGEDEYVSYLKAWSERESMVFSDKTIYDIAEWMNCIYGLQCYKENLVHWILDAGFTRIKLWGRGWDSVERFKPYSMGPAENGETLSRIYQSSKIVLATNVICTATARVGESMLSGAFYIANYIPPEKDFVDLRRKLKENVDFVMHHNKLDLIKKLDFYLTHEEERKNMIEKGRNAAQKHLSFDGFFRRFLREASEILKYQSEG